MNLEKKASTIPPRDMFIYRNVDLMGVHAFETITVKAINKMCNIQDDDIVIVKMKKNNELVMGKVRHETSMDTYDFDSKNHIVGIVDQGVLQRIELQEREVDLLCSIDTQWDAIKASNRSKWTTSSKAVDELETFVNTVREYRTLLVRKEQQENLAQKKRDAEMTIRKTAWHRFCDKKPEAGDTIFVYYQHGELSSGFYQYHVNTIGDEDGYLVRANDQKNHVAFSGNDIRVEGSVLWWCGAPGK